VIDAYARRILGWSVATTMTSQLVVDAVEQAIWTRGRQGRDLAGLVAHHDHGTQYLSVAYSEKLDAAGIKPSTGAVGSSYDNALAESIIGLYKTELVKKQRPWKGFDDLEVATAEWVDWSRYAGDLYPGRWDRGGRVTSSIGARPWPSHPAWSARHVLAEAS
jgi:putative transposase